MEAKEFMLNDFVYRKKHEEFHKQVSRSVVKIDGVMDNCITIAPDSEFLDMDEIEPITLTTEIVLKNGFEVEEGGSIMGLAIEDTFTMNIDDEQGQHKWSIIITNGPWNIKIKVFGMLAISIVIKYVHELQHALRLVGLNEVADNIKV